MYKTVVLCCVKFPTPLHIYLKHSIYIHVYTYSTVHRYMMYILIAQCIDTCIYLMHIIYIHVYTYSTAYTYMYIHKAQHIHTCICTKHSAYVHVYTYSTVYTYIQRDFWAETRRINGNHKNMPNIVDQAHGDTEISNLFVDTYEHLYNSVSYNVDEMNYVCVTNLGVDMARFTQFPLMITQWAIIYEIISPGAAGSSIYV